MGDVEKAGLFEFGWVLLVYCKGSTSTVGYKILKCSE